MKQVQQWLPTTNILITDEMNQGSIQIEIPRGVRPHRRKNATICRLWVNSPCRQRGIATRLLYQAEQIAVEHDCDAALICWTRGETKEWTRNWFTRQGYKLHSDNGTDYWLIKKL